MAVHWAPLHQQTPQSSNLGKKVDRKKLAKKYGLKDTDLKIGLIVDFRDANKILDWWNKAKEDIRVIEKTDSKIEKAAQEKAENTNGAQALKMINKYKKQYEYFNNKGYTTVIPLKKLLLT